MANEVELLRLLEPAVRPGGLPAPIQSEKTPLELRSFEALLEEARQINTQPQNMGSQVETQQQTDVPTQRDTGLIKALTQVDQIENGSLRQLIDTNTNRYTETNDKFNTNSSS